MNEVNEDKIQYASDCAGQFLDELGKSDLATLTSEQWFEFLRVVVCRYNEGKGA